MRVLVLGASGTIGRSTVAALLAAGHQVTALLRQDTALPAGCQCHIGDVTRPGAVADLLAAHGQDAIISCLASRSGAPGDAWAIDHGANSLALRAAQAAGLRHFVLLSALCVQQPRLEFQRAKLAFEAELQASGLVWSIIRPTAFFKSLSGQVARVVAGRAFIVFGTGRLTACKPISDRDLGRYLARALTDPQMHGRILPIGGPGPAITPLDQAALLERLLGRPVPVKHMPLALMDAIIALLSTLGRLSPKLAEKANLARIGRYYASHSMLVWTGTQYDAAATPEFGSDTLRDHYAALLTGQAQHDLGPHRVF